MSLRSALLLLTLVAVVLAHATASSSEEVALRGLMAYVVSLLLSVLLARITTQSKGGFFQKLKELSLYFTLLASFAQFGCQMRFSDHEDKVTGMVLAALASLFLTPAFFSCIHRVEGDPFNRELHS